MNNPSTYNSMHWLRWSFHTAVADLYICPNSVRSLFSSHQNSLKMPRPLFSKAVREIGRECTKPVCLVHVIEKVILGCSVCFNILDYQKVFSGAPPFEVPQAEYPKPVVTLGNITPCHFSGN